MDGQEPVKKEYPYYAVGTLPPDVPIEEKPEKWWIRAGIRIGALMSTTTPKVWSLNPAVVTLLILIAGMIGGGGYYLGHQAAVQNQMQRELDKVAADEKRRKELEIYNSRQTDEQDGHAIKPKENKK